MFHFYSIFVLFLYLLTALLVCFYLPSGTLLPNLVELKLSNSIIATIRWVRAFNIWNSLYMSFEIERPTDREYLVFSHLTFWKHMESELQSPTYRMTFIPPSRNKETNSNLFGWQSLWIWPGQQTKCKMQLLSVT